MRILLLSLLFLPALFAQEKDSFITEQEYAQNLYENPRGIGCNKCHGKKGEGMLIARYKHKNENRILKTESINYLSFEKFQEALRNKKGVMPKYFLTASEIKTLYNYLHKEKKSLQKKSKK